MFEASLETACGARPADGSIAGRRCADGSDLSNAEWAILEPLLPPPCACGRKRKWPMRRMVEAILFIMRAGCAWDMLPKA